MEVAHFINQLLSKGGKTLTEWPEPGLGWDWYGIVRIMTDEIDFDCQFEKYAPGCRNYKKISGLCCCGGCYNSMGYLYILPNNYTILTAIANKFVVPSWAKRDKPRPCNPDVTEAEGFWKPGKGCQLPRRYRSGTCLGHKCESEIEMPKRHQFLLREMLNRSDLIRHRNGFLELYGCYAGRLPTIGRLSNKFRKAFWYYVDTMLERSNVDVNTPPHTRIPFSEVERCIRDGDWRKLKHICNLYGVFGPVDDSYRLQNIAWALIDRCAMENWKGDISAESADTLRRMLIVNKTTGVVHVGVPSNTHGTLCNAWGWGIDMQVTSAMNITCKRCLNLLKTRENT